MYSLYNSSKKQQTCNLCETPPGYNNPEYDDELANVKKKMSFPVGVFLTTFFALGGIFVVATLLIRRRRKLSFRNNVHVIQMPIQTPPDRNETFEESAQIL